ncbi:unnamed protein product [Closterium sp. NIES-54]
MSVSNMEVAIFGATACAAVFAQYAFIRCGLHGSFTSASWPEATLPDVQNITRVSNLVLSVYERDLTEPRFSDAVPPARVVKSVSYDDTRGQCPPYTVFLDPDAKDVCVAIRGLHLTHEADYAVLLNNRTGQQRLEEGYAHKGLLQAAQWLLEREAESLKELLRANPGFSLTLSGHSLGSGIASLLAILLASSPDRIGILPPGKLHCLAFAPPRVVSLNLAVKYSDVITSVVLQDDFLPRTALPLQLIFGAALCLPCLLAFSCMKDTLVPAWVLHRNPARLYIPGRVLHIVYTKFCSCASLPPVVKEAVPREERFEHLVCSMNSLQDHSLVRLRAKAQGATVKLLESNCATLAPPEQIME